MRVSAARELVAALAPLFTGEASVFRAYWDAPWRSPETDRRWMRLQAGKELWDSFTDVERGLFLGPVEELRRAFPRLDRGVGRHQVLAVIDALRDEFSHYVLFADLHDALGPPLDPHDRLPFPENDALAQLRAAHRAEHGRLGMMACRLTEGGYGTLFREGAALAGRGGIDDAIAAACATVLAEELAHMGAGVRGVTAGDVDLLARLGAEQMAARIRMRNAQFSRPLSDDDVARAISGALPPHPFDWDALSAP